MLLCATDCRAESRAEVDRLTDLLDTYQSTNLEISQSLEQCKSELADAHKMSAALEAQVNRTEVRLLVSGLAR